VASTAQLIAAKTTKNPLALWHLLSLDAPTVAALWTWFIARASHIRLPLASPAAMAIAVWMLYAGDRLLDVRLLDARTHGAPPRSASLHHELEARHLFHHRHRRAFLYGIAFAATALAALLPHLNAAAIHLYFIEGALLFVWFLILHATHGAHRLPKEITVGLFFAAATFIPTVSRTPVAHPPFAQTPFLPAPALHLALLPAAILFAALCSLNCLFIYAWEHPHAERPGAHLAQRPHATTRVALRHLTALSICAIIAAALTFFDTAVPKPIPAACALSAVLLLFLDRNRHRLPEVTLRAAADLALLTPVALLPFTR
jgi:hypothetical protein